MSEVLSAEWQVWIASNLIRGRSRSDVAAELIAQGLEPQRAASEVDALAQTAGVIAAGQALRTVDLAHRLRRAHLRLAPREVPVRSGMDRESFVAQHVAAQVPVLLSDLSAGWAARGWTWQGLAERFGDIDIEVCAGRAAADLPDRRFREHTVVLPFRAVVERILDPATGNDLYVVANNHALEGPLAGMLADVGSAAAALDPARLKTSSAWIGPAGARTPLHHDTSDVVLCQFLGRKRILLAPPEEAELANHAWGFWCNLDLDDPAGLAEAGLAGCAIREVVVAHGDALLIPSGWWHQVTSLDPGISLTFAGLWHPNDFRWYHPGPPETDLP